MLWFGLRQRLVELEGKVASLVNQLPEMTAALENAADLYNRAAARNERAGIHQRARDQTPVAAGAGSLEEIRRRRGGV